jgi:mannosyltransferase
MRPSADDSRSLWVPAPQDRLALAGILLLAGFLRFFRLSQQSYWADEVFSVWQVNGHDGPVFDNLLHSFHGPLHLGVLWLWGQWGGWGELWTRSLSVLAGLATVWLIYVLARKIAGRRVALWSALLLAVSPFHVWYSQETRNYAQLLLLVVLSQILFLGILNGARIRTWVSFFVVSLGAVLSNLAALFLFAFQGLYLLRRGAGLVLKLVLVVCLLAVVLYPWLKNFELRWEPEMVGRAAVVRHLNFHPLAVPYTFMTYSIGDTVGPSRNEINQNPSFELFKASVPFLVVAGITFGFLTAQGLRACRKKREGVWFFSLWIMLPILVVAVLAMLNMKAYNVRYVSVGFPAFLILLGMGIEKTRPRLRVIFVSIALLATGFSLYNVYANPRYWKPDARTAALEVGEMAKPGDAIVVYSIEEPFRFYYDGPGEIQSLNWAVPPQGRFWSIVDGLYSDSGRVWLVDYRAWYMDPEGKIPRVFGERWRRAREYKFVGVDVTLFENPTRTE